MVEDEMIRRIEDVDREIEWLSQGDEHGSVTGFSPARREAQTWILHAMYEDPGIPAAWSHDELRRKAIAAGGIEPTVIGGVSLDDETTDTGIPLGYVRRPSANWRRLLWREYLGWGNGEVPSHRAPPCYGWFPESSFPVSIMAPPEGSLDEESFATLLDVLTRHANGGAEVQCHALYASMATPDAQEPELWVGALPQVRSLLEENGGAYGYTPSNLWPEDRSWFVWTDFDLQGTRISGTRQLIDAIKAAPALETIDWTSNGAS